MGKRELLIAIAFIVVGAAAYHLTAPPPKPGQEGFSFARFWNDASRGMRRNSAEASVTLKGTIPLRTNQQELRVSGVNRGVRIMGESRTDISYELTATSNGPDQPAAAALAGQVALKPDDLGTILSLRATFPHEGIQWASLVVHVPTRMAGRIDGGNGAYASNLAAIDIENVGGDVTILEIAGALTGLHRNGDLRATGIGVVKLVLNRSQAAFDHVARGLTLDARNGELHIKGSSGPIQLDAQGTETTITEHSGTIRVVGAGGRVTIASPHDETSVDMRGTEVDVTLTTGVALSLLTSEDVLRLLLNGSPAITVDAVASEGQIQAADFQLHGETGDREAKLSHAFGEHGPRVTLRNSRGDIVIRKAK